MITKARQNIKVEKVIYEMLKENTGIALCDSGGESGRSWQHNQTKKLKDFRNEPEVSYEHDGCGMTISLFHYLKRDLNLDALCNTFNRKFVPMKDWKSDEFYGVSLDAQEWIEEMGFEVKDTFNSYNGDSALSQIIQGTWLELNDKRYLLLQVHGGCDARGGYTDARLFVIDGYEDGALLEDVYGTVTKKDGTEIQVDNRDSMYTLRNEDGDEVKIENEDHVELYLMEY